jgi:hypothetical protein
MAAIQGYSTMLTGLTQEIEFHRQKAESVRSFLFRATVFLRENPDAFTTLNLPSNLRLTASDFFKEGEMLECWEARKYFENTAHSQMASDMIELEKRAKDRLESISRDVTGLRLRKHDIETKLSDLFESGSGADTAQVG